MRFDFLLVFCLGFEDFLGVFGWFCWVVWFLRGVWAVFAVRFWIFGLGFGFGLLIFAVFAGIGGILGIFLVFGLFFLVFLAFAGIFGGLRVVGRGFVVIFGVFFIVFGGCGWIGWVGVVFFLDFLVVFGVFLGDRWGIFECLLVFGILVAVFAFGWLCKGLIGAVRFGFGVLCWFFLVFLVFGRVVFLFLGWCEVGFRVLLLLFAAVAILGLGFAFFGILGLVCFFWGFHGLFSVFEWIVLFRAVGILLLCICYITNKI